MNTKIACFFVLITLNCLVSAQLMAEVDLSVKWASGVSSDQQKTLKNLIKDSENALKHDQPSVEINDTALWKLWAKQQSKKLKKRFSANAYYDTVINIEFDYPTSIVFNITPQQPYRLGDIRLMDTIKSPLKHSQGATSSSVDLTTLSIQPGQPAIANQVIAAESEIVQAIEKQGCFLYVKTQHRAKQRTDQPLIDVTYETDIGPEARIKHYNFEGLESVKESYLRKIISLETPACYSKTIIQNAIIELQETNLFRQIDIRLPKQPDANGFIDVVFIVEERSHRTISSGINFSDDSQFGLELGWQHRNFWGSAEHFSSTFEINDLGWEIENTLKKPMFLDDNQSLNLSQRLGQENTDAYDSSFIGISAAINRVFYKHWLGSIGIDYEFSTIEENNEERDFSIFKFPLSISHDTRTDILNPTSGHHIGLQITPFIAEDEQFQSVTLTSMFYWPLPFWKRSIIATRLSGGQISGTDKENVPAPDRFYTGGGGSVRGYPFQSLGPRDSNQNPEGGLIFIESSFEWRLPLYENIGAVLFADGGNSFDDFDDPQADQIFWGGGIGLRYYTDFGPIRFDVATPFDDTEELDIDENVQLYFSIGQSF